METNTAAMPTSIRPIERPQGPQTSGVQRRGTPASSPFAPRTDVSLQNSVADVANLLSKIASTKEDAMEKISPQVQKLIDSIMQQSFSLESTLAEGLGTTLESQRFAMDQLFTLARMLHQMGSMAEQGKPAALNDQMQALFAGLKEMLATEEGKDMAPTMLHKLAFEVLDGKQADDLPELMQFLWASQGTSGAAATAIQPESDTFGFMKQLMEYFMPRPSAEEMSQSQQQGTQQGAAQSQTPESATQTAQGKQSAQTETTAQRMPEGNEAKGTPLQNAETTAKAAQDGQKNVARDGTVPQQNAQAGQAGEEIAAQRPQTPANQNAAESTTQQTQQTQNAAGQSAQPESAAARRGGASNAQIFMQENEQAEGQAGLQQNAEVNPQDPFAELMRKGLERMRGRIQQQSTQPQQAEPGDPQQQITILGRMPQSPDMQNTPRVMDAMKQLAELVMKNAQLTPEDEQLLLDFVNGDQKMMSEQDARELQALLHLCEKNVPASVLQSAQQKGMEDMPRLWAFMQLCDLAMVKERDGKALKKAGKSISDFASMMKNSLLPENGRTPEGHRSMSFMTPLYMADDMQKPYPAYIHVYDEDKKDENGGPSKKETWIRVCLLTENIGAVDVSFRMYEGSNLDVRIYFSERENLEEFRDYMDEFRASFDDKPLTLMSVKVGVAGVKT